MSKLPLVSVIVLSFNRREETLRAMESLAKQDYKSVEVILLDNGSVDGTSSAVATAFPSVKIFRLPKNYGDWEGRSIALENCSGEFIVCLDDDAWIEPDCISVLVDSMLADPTLALVQPKVYDPETNFVFGDQNCDVEHFAANFLGGAAIYRA